MMHAPRRLVTVAATVYAAIATLADTVRAAAFGAGRIAAAAFSLLGPGVPLARPLHCARCRRTQRYVSRTTARVMARGIRPCCWWCGHAMTSATAKEPTR